MRIGEKFSNVDTGLHLPGSYKVLYELSRMDPSDIERGIETGAITPARQAPGEACPGGPSRPCLVRQIGPLD